MKKAVLVLSIMILIIIIMYAEMVCPKCGEVYSDDMKYCPNDGTKLIKKTEKKETPQSTYDLNVLENQVRAKMESIAPQNTGDLNIPEGEPDYTITDEIKLIRISSNEDTFCFEYELRDYELAFLKYRLDKGIWKYIENRYVIGEINKLFTPGTKAFKWLYGKHLKGTPITNIELSIDVWEKLNYIGTNSKGYKEYKNKKDGSTLIYIPVGEFIMGSNDYNDEKPVHTVYLDGYYISKYEITNKQYKQFCDKTDRSYPKDPGFSGMSSYFTSYPNYPVVNVNWNDAVAYCKWAGLRLPTEAEWHKGSRGTDARTYPWGDSSPGTNKANYDKSGDGYNYTSPVGNYNSGASPYGLMDMAGNVWEWCNDWYGSDYYSKSPKRNPKGPSSGSNRVLCGGSWYFDDNSIRSSNRYCTLPSSNWFNCGFRPAN